MTQLSNSIRVNWLLPKRRGEDDIADRAALREYGATCFGQSIVSNRIESNRTETNVSNRTETNEVNEIHELKN